MKAFFLYSFSLTFFLLLSLYFSFVQKMPAYSLIIKRLFPILECILLSLYYYYNYITSRKKQLFIIGNIFLGAFFIIDFIIDKEKPSFLPLAIEYLFFIFIILFYFYERIKLVSNVSISTIPCFYISVAYLLGFSGTFFLFLYSISMINDPSFKPIYRLTYGSFTIIKNILICVGVFINYLSYKNKIKYKASLSLDFAEVSSFQKNTNQ